MQRATLVPFKDDAAPLKKKVPYDQLRPYKTSELHDMQKTEQNADFSSSSDDIQSLLKGTSPPRSNTTSPCNDDSPILIHDSPPLTNNKTSDNKTNDNKTNNNKTNNNNTNDKTNDNKTNDNKTNDNNTNDNNTNDNKTNDNKTNDNKTDHNKTDHSKTGNDISNTAAPAKGNSKKLKRGRKPNGVWKCTANGNPEELVLTIMEEDYWLTDKHIDHAQWLLSKQFPDSKGLHSVLAFGSKPPKVQKGDKDFVQILHVGGNHWVTVTNIGCQENRIKVFDSLRQKLSKKEKQKLCSCLAVLLNTSLSNMVIEWPSMQRQRGESDCGLFAVAVATSLLNGEDPGSKSYDQSVMKGHLAVCFHCEELAVFPAASSKCVNNDKKEETIEVFCHCRMPFKNGDFMIECSVCLEWFHRSCDKVPRTVTDKTLFHCMNCK